MKKNLAIVYNSGKTRPSVRTVFGAAGGLDAEVHECCTSQIKNRRGNMPGLFHYMEAGQDVVWVQHANGKMAPYTLDEINPERGTIGNIIPSIAQLADRISKKIAESQVAAWKPFP